MWSFSRAEFLVNVCFHCPRSPLYRQHRLPAPPPALSPRPNTEGGLACAGVFLSMLATNAHRQCSAVSNDRCPNIRSHDNCHPHRKSIFAFNRCCCTKCGLINKFVPFKNILRVMTPVVVMFFFLLHIDSICK